MRVTLSPGDAIINCPPTFGMYAFDADLNNAKVVNVPRQADFSLDLDGILAAAEKFAPKLIFITSPNNPDGSLLPQPVLQKLLALPSLIVLDEAYIEFSGIPSQISNVPIYQNLIVLRTFSKLAGLAGLRVGYGGFPSWLMPTLWKTKQPYNVNVAGSVAAIAALDDLDYLDWTVKTLVAERNRLAGELSALPWLTVYPSNSNFILCRVKGRDAAQLKSDLAQQHGIFIRYFSRSGLTDCIRISVGKPEHTDVLLQALKGMG
jgi:histidinol-phosphate aminotransferase